MKTIKILGLIFFSFLLFFSCGRDNDEPTPTTKDYLISGKWYAESSSAITVDACMKNTFFHFKSDNTAQYKVFNVNASSMCEIVSDVNGNYTLSEDNLITYTLGTGSIKLKITSIDNNRLVVEVLDSGIPQTITFDKTEG